MATLDAAKAEADVKVEAAAKAEAAVAEERYTMWHNECFQFTRRVDGQQVWEEYGQYIFSWIVVLTFLFGSISLVCFVMGLLARTAALAAQWGWGAL